MNQNTCDNIRLYKERLNLILDIAQTINEEHSVEALISEFEILLHEELDITRILVYIKGANGWESLLVSGVSRYVVDNIDVERDLLKYHDIETITMSHSPIFDGLDSVIPLYHKYKQIGFVLIGDSNDNTAIGVSPTIKHLKFIQIIANLIVVFIENKHMQNTLIKQETLRNEMELASRIQSGLVPNESDLPKSSCLIFKTLYHPHLGVGGDYYDVINLSRYSVGFCIADVSGKGIAAALLMSNFQAVVRSIFTKGISLKKLVRQLNERVNNSSSNEKFITFFVARYNKITGTLHYINAGHLPPICFDHTKNHLFTLDKGCMGLGMFDTIPNIEEGCVKIHPGTRLLAFTDGLIEIDNGSKIDARLEEVSNIVAHTHQIGDTVKVVKETMNEYIEAGLVGDDVSVLGVEFLRSGFSTLTSAATS